MVAYEIKTDQLIRLWGDELFKGRPPFSMGRDVLYVAYYASAEIQCHLSLDWSVTVNILDLFTEFRCMTNGLYTPSGSGLIGAMVYHGLPVIAAVDKDEMRNLALRGGPWDQDEQNALLDYARAMSGHWKNCFLS